MIRYLKNERYTSNKRLIYAEGLSTDTKPTTGLITGSKFIELDTGMFWVYDETNGWMPRSSQQADNGRAMAARLDTIAKALQNGQGVQIVSNNRIHTLDATTLMAGAWIEAEGVPTYVDDVTDEDYAAYNLTDTGWYVFARIDAPEGSAVTANTTVTGAKAIITPEDEYVDVAVRFDVAAETVEVVIDWDAGEEDNVTERFFFKATDLAVRNLDYRTTFYVYDLAPFVTWQYAVTTDATAAEGKKYYTKDGNTYTAVELETGAACAAYYELVGENEYALTEDETFVDGKTYYTYNGTAYTAATVTAGDAIPPVYYNHSKCIIQGMTRNITYRLDEIIDCPQEVVLPDVEDDTHGCWFEFQLRHSGSFSMTLTVPEGVKIATEHTQAESAGFNLIDLHYMKIDEVEMWRFMNTHSSIPTT